MRKLIQLQIYLLAFSMFSSAILGVDLRPLTNEEVIEDLHQLHNLIRDYYGPLQMKEKTIKFELDNLISDAKIEIRNAKNENQALGALAHVLGKLNDGHVGLTFPEYASAPGQVKLPIFLTPIENRAIVGSVEDAAKGLGIDIGDEVISIDGTKVMDFVGVASKYQSFGNPRSNTHLLYRATLRPTFMTELAPKGSEARLEVKKTNGKTLPFTLIWRPQTIHDKKILFVEPPKGDTGLYVPQAKALNAAAGATLLALGANDPFFITPQNKAKFNITTVSANEESLAKFNVNKEKPPHIFSALYTYKKKNVLLIRQPTYEVENFPQYIQHYKAILSQYEPFVDVLVIDQTHNPGGQFQYLEAFFRLFIQDKSASVVQFMRADRKWVRKLETWAKQLDTDLESEASRQMLLRAKTIESAYERGDFFIPVPIPINQTPEVSPDPEYTWKKPLLVLTDELSGSCGDIFPLVMKNVGWKTFGQPTMGVGGTVEPVGELTHSGGEVRLTRGLFALYKSRGDYTERDLVENSGIPVDYSYEHTVEDFRNGFLKYVEAFSKAAIKQIK